VNWVFKNEKNIFRNGQYGMYECVYLHTYLIYSYIHNKIFFGSLGVLTQGLWLTKKEFYHLSHTPQPFSL
jgi:hypothetical protein